MAIRVARNAAGNCVVFFGQTNPVYYNACLSAIVEDTDYVSVVNDIASAPTQQDVTPKTEYEFYRIHFSEWRDSDNGTFTSAQEAAAYINSIGNVTDVPASGFVFQAEDVMDFIRDETNTSILFSNGDHHGVNSIKAILKDNGLIGLYPERSIDVEFYEIPHTAVTINGSSPGSSPQTVVNALNALFTVTAYTSPIPLPSYTQDGGTDVAWVELETQTPVGGTAGVDVGYDPAYGSYHGSRVYTAETINEPGEYFTFEIENLVAGSGPLMGIGLYSVDDGDLAEITNGSLSNSGHHGYWYSQWLYNYNGYTAPWTTYGSKSSLVYGPGWTGSGNAPMFRYSDVHEAFRPGGGASANVLIKVGITDEGFAGIWYLDTEIVGVEGNYGGRSNDWVLMSRSSTPLPVGEYGIMVKLASTSAVIRSKPKRFATDPAAPTLYYRYAESPDNNFVYPLFASEEEANWVDTLEGGSGTSHTHTFPDDLTGTVWYMPDTGYFHTAPSAPLVPGITYTEIPTEDDPEPLPPAFTDTTITVDELSLVNYQLSPVDVNYVTTIGGIPNWSIIGGTTLTGIAPEVTGNNVDNPSDTTTVTVYRTNSAGTTSGTLTINITNLTQPVTPIAGYHHESTSTPMVDSDTLADGSVVRVQDNVQDGERIHFETTWMTNSMLAALNSVGDGVAKVYMGILSSSADLSSLTEADFDFGVMYYKNGANDYRMRYISGGSFASNTGLGTDGVTFSWELLFANDSTDDTYELSTAPSSLNPENILMNSDGGSWSSFFMTTTLTPGNKDFHIGVTGTTMDISTTGVDEHPIPTPPVTNDMDTDWTKALDFSGSAERTEMVSGLNNYNPMMMGGTNNQVSTPASGQTTTDGHPWATACVFRVDGHNSNQHIWNIGEGAGDNDDNIYLRLDSSQRLYFGWGRAGDLNELFITTCSSAIWFGIYVGHNGARYGDGTGASGASSGNLTNSLDIRLMSTYDNFSSLLDVSTLAGWQDPRSQIGGRQNRQYQGKLTIGGRGSNRSFHGKVASFVTTTLRNGVAMPNDAEITEMITDPMGWLNDYKVGNAYRAPWNEGSGNDFTNFQLRNTASNVQEPKATQVYLMGDGSNDSYSNMIRNRVNPADQNNTKMNMISMVSNDIQNVNIPGLTD